MVTLVYIATTFIKPALFILMILSCLSAAIYLTTTPTRSNKMPKVDTRQIRKMIKIFGREKVKEILKEKGLTLKDLGIR